MEHPTGTLLENDFAHVVALVANGLERVVSQRFVHTAATLHLDSEGRSREHWSEQTIQDVMSIEFEHPSERKEVEIAQVRISQHMQKPAQRDIGLRTQARVRIEQGLVGQVQDLEIAILATRVRMAPALHTFLDATRQSKVF